MILTLSGILCLLAIVLWLLRAFQGYLQFSPRLHLGWLGLALYGISLLVR